MLGYLRTFMANLATSIRPVAREPDEFRPTRTVDPEGGIKPFHEALVPEGVLRTSDFERSFSTGLGASFEEVAKLVARDYYQIAERNHKLKVSIPKVALDTIDAIISDIGSDGVLGRYLEHVASVAAAYKGDVVERKRPLTIDLYLRAHDGSEYYFEMKSPKPNKDQAVGAIRKLLIVHGVKGQQPPDLRTFYTMAYNPYGVTRGDYNESVARKYLDFENMVLIGEEFWTLMGGSGTYEEVLETYRQVGRELGPLVWSQLTGVP